jgi:hypothetical protein
MLHTPFAPGKNCQKITPSSLYLLRVCPIK